MRKFVLPSLLGLLAAFTAACGVVSKKQALDEFLAEYPKATVYEQFIGEGDSDAAYMHFRYTETGSEEKKEVMWVYLKQSDGKWRASSKSEPKKVGSNFGD